MRASLAKLSQPTPASDAPPQASPPDNTARGDEAGPQAAPL